MSKELDNIAALPATAGDGGGGNVAYETKGGGGEGGDTKEEKGDPLPAESKEEDGPGNMKPFSTVKEVVEEGEGGEPGERRKSVLFNFDEVLKDGAHEIVEEEWSFEHVKLLYMMSKYAVCARSAHDSESWIRQIPLLVLMFEGITAGSIDFDYAPASMLITLDGKSRRVWMNVTQEGKAAVDDLREKGLINGLKLSTEDFQPVTAYQVSRKGLKLVDTCPQEIKEEVDKFLFPPPPNPQALLTVQFVAPEIKKDDDTEDEDSEDEEAMRDNDLGGVVGDGGDDDEDNDQGHFLMVARWGVDGEYSRESNVTETEDVSYVSSPYLPHCVRNPRDQQPFTSNQHRRHESATGTNNIEDELSEAIVLSQVLTMVGEWIPFGSNQIVALNERLGALDRCQGGLFTAMVDTNPTKTQFEVPPGLTQVTILDYDFVHFINFEAEINYPEEDGIVQIENFGMHLNVDGTVIYGLKVEAIMERTAESISLDHLSRLLVDVHQDSSAIMNDLLSHYQRELLDMLFMGDSDNRGKFNMIVSENIEPFLPAEEYMDREDNENELKQVLGDLHAAHDIGEDGVLIVGRDGMLVAGTNANEYEALLACYLSLLCRETFIRNFFTRTFIMDDLLKKIRSLILSYQSDPNNIQVIRLKLNDGSKDIILLLEVLEYLKESLNVIELPPRPADNDPTGQRLFDLLNVESQFHDIVLRTDDLAKLVNGAQHELTNLQQMTDVINTKQLEDVFRNVEANTKYLVDASAANERASASLEVMQVILAGSFAFDMVDRLSGGSLNITVPDWINSYLVDTIIAIPMVWWLANMVWLLGVSYGLLKFMRFLGSLANGALTLRVQLDKKIRVDKWAEFLETRKLEVIDSMTDAEADTIKVTWFESDKKLWKGECPKLEAQVDETFGFLLTVTFSVNGRNTKLEESDMVATLLDILTKAKVLDTRDKLEEDAKKAAIM